MTKFKVTATIPVGNYANVQPEIEVEAETYELAQAEAMGKLEAIWRQYGVVPLNKQNGERKLVDCFVGGQIYYDGAAHVYSNEAGETYLSGSTYAKQFEKEFDAKAISEALAKKFKVSAQDILDMWQLKSEISMGLGTALHGAMELFGKYDGLATTMEKTTSLHTSPMVMNAVELFYKGKEKEKAVYEVFIADHAQKHAGQVDRLIITGDKECIIEDFKTGEVEKRLPVYYKQLEFYKGIMESHGWVATTRISYWDGKKWTYYQEES